MNDALIFWAGTLVPFLIAYAVGFLIVWWRRRNGRRSVGDMPARERELLERITALEASLADGRAVTERCKRDLAVAELRVRQFQKIINDLKRENEALARKPLTDEQLRQCLDNGGATCPRCGDDENLNAEDLEADDDEASLYTQDVTCGECNERFRLVFTLARVEPIEE